jgi:hypothetical protein
MKETHMKTTKIALSVLAAGMLMGAGVVASASEAEARRGGGFHGMRGGGFGGGVMRHGGFGPRFHVGHRFHGPRLVLGHRWGHRYPGWRWRHRVVLGAAVIPAYVGGCYLARRIDAWGVPYRVRVCPSPYL